MPNIRAIALLGILSLLALGLGFIAPPATTLPPTQTLLSSETRERLERMLLESGVLDPARYQDALRTELNLLWALGLANRNPILEAEMEDSRYGGAENFASTGGWTLAHGSAMEHYNAHEFIVLTPAQQALVEKVSSNIYRPCCDNSTRFPDCNHGMAMLGFLELLAAEGKSEQELYAAALRANQEWFPDHYRTIAAHLATQGVAWERVDPKRVLGKEYSSATGFSRIRALVEGASAPNGQSCSV